MVAGRFILIVSCFTLVAGFKKPDYCEAMDTETLKKFCNFNATSTPYVQFPNFLGQENQKEAIEKIHGYELLLTAEKHCSDKLALFLCFTYLPLCNPESSDVIVKPCRAECEMSRYNCSSLMIHYGYPWPEALSCDSYPWAGSKEATPWCVGDNVLTQEYFQKHYPEVTQNGSYNVIEVDDDELKVPDARLYNSSKGNCHTIGLHNTALGHSFNKYDCGLPCKSRFYGPKNDTKFLSTWILVWSCLCFAATLFTVITFLFEQERFRYPERAIILSAFCYFFISVGFILGYAYSDKIVCEPSGPSRISETSVTESVIRQHSSKSTGDKMYTALCFIQFFLVYYFILASFLWWVILNMTWFLAAGLKWGHEAIGLKAKYFHLVAWVIPAIFFCAVCADMGEIDGDRLANICFVGNFSTRSLQLYLIGPLCVFYIFGILFLGLGMLSMCNVRHELSHSGKKTDKLETLMIRIGVFSVLYSIPATIVIVCFFYENFQKPSWERDYVSHCYTYGKCNELDGSGYKPNSNFLIFNLIKYLMMLVTGLSTGFWVLLSVKTAHKWMNIFICRFPCRNSETAV